jgi:hypothetical protein
VERVAPLSSVCGIHVASVDALTWSATLVVLVDMFLEKQGGAAGRAAVAQLRPIRVVDHVCAFPATFRAQLCLKQWALQVAQWHWH